MGKDNGWQRLGELSQILQAFRHMYLHRQAEEDHPSLVGWRRQLRQFLKVNHRNVDLQTPTRYPVYSKCCTSMSLSLAWATIIESIPKSVGDSTADNSGRVFVADAAVLDIISLPLVRVQLRGTQHFFVPAQAPNLPLVVVRPAVQDLVLSCGFSAPKGEGAPWVHYDFDTFSSALTHSYCDWCVCCPHFERRFFVAEMPMGITAVTAVAPYGNSSSNFSNTNFRTADCCFRYTKCSTREGIVRCSLPYIPYVYLAYNKRCHVWYDMLHLD